MKRVLFVFAVILFFASTVHTQTELWRSTAYFPIASADGLGNLYVGTTHAAPGNSLSKLDSGGNILWEVPITTPSYYFLRGIPGGVYVCPGKFSVNKEIFFYNSTGTIQWTYSLETEETMSAPRLDPSGNLVIKVDSGHQISKLFKISPSGEKLFEVRISRLIPGSYTWPFAEGPTVTSTGDVWILMEGDYEQGFRVGLKSHYETYLMHEAVLFDGTSGAQLLRKRLSKILVEKVHDNGRGWSSTYSLNGGPLTMLTGNYDQLIAYGTFDYEKDYHVGMRINKKQRSEWLLMTMDRQGNINKFKYHGPGKTKFTEFINGFTIKWDCDGQANVLNQVMVMEGNGALYLHGTVNSKRTPRLGGTGLQTDDVLIKFDPIRKKIAWKIIQPSPEGRDMYPMILYPAGEKIFMFRGRDTIDVIDANGKISTQPMIFTHPVYMNTEHDMVLPNKELGSLLIYGYNCPEIQCWFISKWDISSFLANAEFKNHVVGSEEQISSTSFTLSQNYPNPFNPTTTIEFELASDALVTVKIYNTLGQEIITLAEKEWYSEGYNDLQFDGSGLPSGVYFYRITAEDIEGEGILYSNVKKMILVK